MKPDNPEILGLEPNIGHSHKDSIQADELERFKEVAAQNGVTVEVVDRTEGFRKLREVPKTIKVIITSDNPNISGFWTELEKRRKEENKPK